MSSQSDAACLSVMRGADPGSYFEVEWAGTAESTWNHFLRSVDLPSTIHERDQRLVDKFENYTPPKCFLYLAKCCVFDGSATVFKVGISVHVPSRMSDHARNPLLSFSDVMVSECGSRAIATCAETSFLVSAAKAGFWLGSEWIAGCDKSRKILSVTARCAAADRRFRIRRRKAVADGI